MKRFYAALFAFFLAFAWTPPASALEIIRDAETETMISELATPLFRAAGFDADAIHVYIVRDDAINAYVAEGKNIFLHTSLLLFDDDPTVLAGVVAHELGHIRGGHLVRRKESAKDLTAGAALGYVLGLATGALAGPAAGTAILGASQHVLGREMLREGRGHEDAADRAAAEFMSKAGYPPDGLIKLLSYLQSQESASPERVDPYTVSHPLSAERLAHIKDYERAKTLSPDLPRLRNAYRFVHAKLTGFLEDPEYVVARYHPDNPAGEKIDLPEKYGSAVGYFRQSRFDEAFSALASLPANVPNAAFVEELKAQFSFESGYIDDAVRLYGRASSMRPDISLLKAQYATALISAANEKNDPGLQKAVDMLIDARLKGETSRFILKELGVAYGKMENVGQANLYLAEWAIAGKDVKEADTFLKLAEKRIDPGTPADVRLRDVRYALKKLREEKKSGDE
ncbi:MAG: M48 family metalloprotease [Rickettsiales bacterium]